MKCKDNHIKGNFFFRTYN